jgi:hypothetical protein
MKRELIYRECDMIRIHANGARPARGIDWRRLRERLSMPEMTDPHGSRERC